MSTMTYEQVVEKIAANPSIADLENVTRLSLPDLIRLGSTETTQATGAFGEGENACALSAAALAWDALRKR